MTCRSLKVKEQNYDAYATLALLIPAIRLFSRPFSTTDVRTPCHLVRNIWEFEFTGPLVAVQDLFKSSARLLVQLRQQLLSLAWNLQEKISDQKINIGHRTITYEWAITVLIQPLDLRNERCDVASNCWDINLGGTTRGWLARMMRKKARIWLGQ